MVRLLIAGLLVVGLAVGVWILWPEGDPTSPTTTVAAVETTTSSRATTAPPSSTPTTIASHIVSTVEEAEAVLAALWFGWFEGIYNEDEARIREVVGSQRMLDDARAAFGSVAFVSSPTREGVRLVETEILESSEECLVTWVSSLVTFVDQTEPLESVEVLRRVNNQWRLVSTWRYRNDLWEADCVSSLEPLS